MKYLLFLLPALLGAVPVSAQSLLLVVRETLNGSPLPAPYSSREGLAAALFDDGFIVFDLPGEAPARSDGLLSTAAEAGADWVLELRIDYVSRGAAAPRIQGHAAYTLSKTAGGAIALQGTLDGTNKDRERTVDRPALGLEMGGLVAEKVRERLSGPSLQAR